MIRADGLCLNKGIFYDIGAKCLAYMCIELVHSMPLATSFRIEGPGPELAKALKKSQIETNNLSP